MSRGKRFESARRLSLLPAKPVRDVRRLTTYDPIDDPKPGVVQVPVISPDGEKIAFASNRLDPTDGTTDFDIWQMDANDGSGLTDLTGGAGLVSDVLPEFSPDGSRIAFTSARPLGSDRDIWVMSAKDGSGQTDLTDNITTQDLSATWSPDGTKIAFYTSPGGPLGFYTSADI